MSNRINKIQALIERRRLAAEEEAAKPVVKIRRKPKPVESPDKTWTKAKLLEFAKDNGVEVSSSDTKAVILDKLGE
tara:strand:+ start:378 stop:605 length:228 start_codon:yes stop_codon:yes gene_type:complete